MARDDGSSVILASYRAFGIGSDAATNSHRQALGRSRFAIRQTSRRSLAVESDPPNNTHVCVVESNADAAFTRRGTAPAQRYGRHAGRPRSPLAWSRAQKSPEGRPAAFPPNTNS